MKKFLSAAVIVLTLPLLASGAPLEGANKPTWEKISKAYDAYFAQVKGHHASALITRTQVEPLWEPLTRAGWPVPADERASLMKLIPKEGEFMVRQLRSTSGRKFMWNVATKYPEIYDRLDRLCHTDGGGRPAAAGLISAPDALLTVKYMFSKGGELSWSSLMQDKKSFNKPTGRIYTAEALKSRLEELFFTNQLAASR